MTPIKQIVQLPDFDWNDRTLEELVCAQDVVRQSTTIWQVGTAAVAGFYYESLTAPPWMWFALSRGITFRDLIDFRRVAEYIPSGTLTLVLEGAEPETRFAKFYKFEPQERTLVYRDRLYRVFRRI